MFVWNMSGGISVSESNNCQNFLMPVAGTYPMILSKDALCE